MGSLYKITRLYATLKCFGSEKADGLVFNGVAEPLDAEKSGCCFYGVSMGLRNLQIGDVISYEELSKLEKDSLDCNGDIILTNCFSGNIKYSLLDTESVLYKLCSSVVKYFIFSNHLECRENFYLSIRYITNDTVLLCSKYTAMEFKVEDRSDLCKLVFSLLEEVNKMGNPIKEIKISSSLKRVFGVEIS